jgi:ribonuclease P protein subunit POP4
MRLSRTILWREFIGLEVEVIKSTHLGYVGIKGKIIDETKNTFVILQGKKRKRIPKAVCVFLLLLPNGRKVEVNGKLIAYRPEERIKKI